MPDTILEGDHPRIISAKFGWDWLSSFRGELFQISSPLFSIFSLAAILVRSRDHRTQFERGPSKNYATKVWLQLAQWFPRRRLLCEFHLGSYVKLSSAVGAILFGGMKCRTPFWKGTPKDHFSKVWLRLAQYFQRRFFCLISSTFFLFLG